MQFEVRLWFEDVARILPRLQRLQRITLHQNAANSNLHDEFLVAFINCLQLPSMAEVLILHATKFPLVGCQDVDA